MSIDVEVKPQSGDEFEFEILKDFIYEQFLLIHMKTHAKDDEFNISIKNYIKWHPFMYIEKDNYFFIFAHFSLKHAEETRKDVRKAARIIGVKIRTRISK